MLSFKHNATTILVIGAPTSVFFVFIYSFIYLGQDLVVWPKMEN